MSPALTEEHARLIDALIQLKEDELAIPLIAATRTSDVPVMPYYGDQIYVTEDGSRIEASDDEQGVGLGRWLVLLLEHVFQPFEYTVNGEIEWDGADDLQDRGSFYVKDNVLEVIDTVIFAPGPSWAPNHFADELLQKALSDLLASEDNTGCTENLTP